MYCADLFALTYNCSKNIYNLLSVIYLIMMTKMLIHTTHFYRNLLTNRFSTVMHNINRYPIGISLMVTKCLLLCPLSSDSKLRPLFPPPQIKYCTLYIHTMKSRFRHSQTAIAVTLFIQILYI